MLDLLSRDFQRDQGRPEQLEEAFFVYLDAIWDFGRR